MKKVIIDHATLKRTIRRLSYEIIEKHEDISSVVLIGIKEKGVVLANLIQENIRKIEGISVNTGSIDIRNYRDDVKEINPQINNNLSVPFDINNMQVILVDDVLYTGRTIRAAMDAIIDLGRPMVIELLVLVDRGHRQFPIKANYIGKNIPTSQEESIIVELTDFSETDNVSIVK